MPPINPSLESALRARIDGKAKPPGSLGRIEDLAVRLGLIQNRLDPVADQATILLFAGDHGPDGQELERVANIVEPAIQSAIGD